MGNLAHFFREKNPSCQAVCVDIKQDYLDLIAKRDPDIKTVLYDINQPLPFKDQSFTMASCIGTLHYSYIEYPEKVLGEMARVSQKYILIDCFSKYSPWALGGRIFRPRSNPRRKSSSEMKRIFRRYNLKLVRRVGIRTPFSKVFPFSGKTVFFLLKKWRFSLPQEFIRQISEVQQLMLRS